MRPLKHWKLLIIWSNMPRTIYEPGFKCDHWNIESYWSSDQICCGQYMNLGSNATMETLKAIDHPIKYAADNIWTWVQMWPLKHRKLLIIRSHMPCRGQYKWTKVQMRPLKYWKLIDHPIKYAADNINVPGFKCDHWNIESYWSYDQNIA